MRSDSRVIALIAGAGLALSAPGASGSESARLSLLDRSWETDLETPAARLRLPDAWIDPGSVLVVLEAETLRSGVDYRIEPTEGLLHLLVPQARGRLRLRYAVVPLAIGRVFQDPIPIDTARGGTAPIRPSVAATQVTAGAARLELRGMKTVGLEVGSSEDLSLRQSLDVTLSGELAPGVSVRGVLSDRQTPLQPEGRTTELADLDRVYMQIEGRGVSATLGDFDLRGPPGLFTDYRRQLEGIRLDGRRGRLGGSVAAATVPGEFGTAEFLTEEGKQGPYRLLAQGGSSDAVILAGSENVWLDGELLVRGDDRDYTIDYSASTITFTGRRVVGKDSRITVDFQASSQPFRRSAYGSEVRWGEETGKTLSLRATLMAERDDVGKPVGGPLTDRERETLRRAGDADTSGFASGIDCGAVGHGDYEWVEADTLDQPFLRYVGPDSATCKVRFDDVGAGKGDYADSLLADSAAVYRFVGKRKGRFLPGRAVPRPSERGLVDVAASLAGPAGFRLDIEGAGSFDDRNTLSPLDDGDRRGGALHLALAREISPVSLMGRDLGRWGMRVETRDLDPFFRSMGRLDPGWYGYGWGIAEGRLGSGDRRRSLELRQEPGWGLAVDGSYETLSNRRDLEGSRDRLILRRQGRVHASIERTRARSRDGAAAQAARGRRAVDAGGLGVRLPWAEASGSLRRERAGSRTLGALAGAGFDEWRLGGAYILRAEAGRAEISRIERRDHLARDGRWQGGDRARTWEGRILWSPSGRLLDGRYARRDLSRREGGRQRSDIAGLLWSEDRSDGRYAHQLRLDLTTSQEEGRIKSIEYVGSGRGRYDSLGVYVGEGDYDLVLVPSGTAILQRRMEGSWRFDCAPGRGRAGDPASALSKLWLSSQWLLHLSFSARTAGSASAFWRDLPDLVLARKTGVPLAFHRARAEGSALPRARWASPQIRVDRERSESRTFENVQTGRAKDLIGLTLRSLPAKGWTIEQEAELARELERSRLLSGGSSAGSLGWDSRRLRLGCWWRPRGGWVLRLAAAGRLRERIPTKSRYTITQATPGLQWLPRESVRFDMQATRTWVEGPRANLLGLEKEGWEARGSAGLKLRRSLDLSVILNLAAPEGVRSRADVRAEMKAYF